MRIRVRPSRNSVPAKRRHIVAIVAVLVLAVLLMAAYLTFNFSNAFLSQIRRSPAPASQEELLRFGANEIPALRAEAESRLDKSKAAFLGDIYKPVATSYVDVCYQSPTEQGFAAREYRKYCYLRHVMLMPVTEYWQDDSKKVYDRLTSQGWASAIKQHTFVGKDECFYRSDFRQSDATLTEHGTHAIIDVFVGPINPSGIHKDTLCEFDTVGQVQGVQAARAVSLQEMIFYQKNLFNEDQIKRNLQDRGFKDALRIGFTEEYFNEKIK